MNGTISLRLGFRRPYPVHRVFDFLAARCVRGVEELVDGLYRRTVRLPNGIGIVELAAADDHFVRRAHLQDERDTGALGERCRSFLDLDCDPIAIEEVLKRDPALRRAVESLRGLRIVRTLDVHELALRAVLGQQVSVAAAVTAAGRVADLFGIPFEEPSGSLTRLFPSVADLAVADLSGLKMPAARRAAFGRLAAALAAGEIALDGGTDPAETYEQLLTLPGIGPWTASYICMRTLGDPDAFLAGDLGARRGAAVLGLPETAPALEAHSERWRPWRAYGLQYLWAALTP
ncbi:MAG: hypothetical protein M3516_02965 [Actinomycetota bacterium]|nr:hypothetical protein [Actinomycetota bacterium]